MVLTETVLAITLSVYFSNAQNPQPSRQMPQYQAGGFEEFAQRELHDPQQQVKVSSRQRCVLEQHERIECGESDITEDDCDAISCCYDGQGCYYARAVTLQCTRDGQFVLVVARDATLPHINLDSIHLLEDNPSGQCASVGTTATFAIYQFPVSSCGTKKMEEDHYIIYENMMSTAYEVGIGPRGSVTRDSAYELKFQCRYSGSGVEALMMEVNTVPPPLPVSQQGPLRVELRLANGQCTTKGCTDDDVYASYYSEEDYPVTKALREPLYVEVRILERNDPNIVLVLDHCWATSTQDPQSLPQWDLIVNGCPYKDDHSLTTMLSVGKSELQYPSHYKRFVMKMFTFVDQPSLVPLQERIIIHCTTSVCHSLGSESCESSCGRTRRAVSEQSKDSEEKVLVSSGEVMFISDLPISKDLVDADYVSHALVYGLWSVAAITVFGVFGLVVAVLIRRVRPQPAPV
ncbi:zona pellucida glycoprotein 2, like 2 isoform X2 [Triplophysa dalaica]|uniref:zona pellucida glycoprotein 2, like 2 isoform X2 n=1 Tax=Triplophysa dalaica TaxID=1582913 RepID=UPI0024DFCE18|nr:zona pellucida glycoprotein 2, like 2 isoform X2 [Triplophysa dalaica]